MTEVLIIGAGAAGLMCAIEAGKRGRVVVVIDHANKVGKKILMSGGGRCNFTNLHIHPDCYLSHNLHFCKSALSRYTAFDFMDLVKKHDIPFHEKTLGQLFCDRKSQDIVDMLLSECKNANVKILLNTSVDAIEHISDKKFIVRTNQTVFNAESLVIATGGLSIPTMGASPFAYKVAEQFGIPVFPTRAGLVPLTLHAEDKGRFDVLSGISVEATVKSEQKSFHENILFTHRGLSGPAILQISSYWKPGESLEITLIPSKHKRYTDVEPSPKNPTLPRGVVGEPGSTAQNPSLPRGVVGEPGSTAQNPSPPRAQRVVGEGQGRGGNNKECITLLNYLLFEKKSSRDLKTVLSDVFPKRLVDVFVDSELASQKINTLVHETLEKIADLFQTWRIKPNGTEGYRTAEVTLGGVDVDYLSSKTMEVHHVPGLYFIGEAVDVTGWLGGYNFQWAWSSGWAAGQVA